MTAANETSRRVPTRGDVLRQALPLGAVLLPLFTPAKAPAEAAPCPRDMVSVADFCIDRHEMSTVDAATSEPLSPYYPPERRWTMYVFDAWETLRHSVGDDTARQMPLPMLSEWQRAHDPEPKARSVQGVVPQGYLSYHSAKRACERASKRLCSDEEWEQACRGEKETQFPYGDDYKSGPCNVGRTHHPAFVLHGLSSSGHLDPRLNLLHLNGDEPVLRVTGASQGCKSRWGSDAIYDMVGNVDEWVEDPGGAFRGGFYARRTQKGCEAQIRSHSDTYFDYSTGARCCKDAR